MRVMGNRSSLTIDPEPLIPWKRSVTAGRVMHVRPSLGAAELVWTFMCSAKLKKERKKERNALLDADVC